MQFKGIEIHNARTLAKGEEGLLIRRLPEDLIPFLKTDASVASGVELRLVPISDEVTIKIKLTEGNTVQAIVYYGSVQSGWKELYKTITSGDCSITVKKSPFADILKTQSERISAPFSPEVIRVVLQSARYEIIDVIGECRPPRAEELPKLKYLAYGSSITHGSLSISPTRTYPFLISEALKTDYLNFGFAGSAMLEPEMADYIADHCEFDFATLEMGINMLKTHDPDEFYGRVKYFVKRIAEAHPDKKIFCIDVFYHSWDFDTLDDPSAKTNQFRRMVKTAVLELGLPNTVYVEGLSILTGFEYLTEDLTHPNATGIELIAKNLLKVIKSEIDI